MAVGESAQHRLSPKIRAEQAAGGRRPSHLGGDLPEQTPEGGKRLIEASSRDIAAARRLGVDEDTPGARVAEAVSAEGASQEGAPGAESPATQTSAPVEEPGTTEEAVPAPAPAEGQPTQEQGEGG